MAARLETKDLEDGVEGAGGWSIGIEVTGGAIISDASVAGTDAEGADFHNTEIVNGSSGVVSAVLLAFDETSAAATLPPEGSPHSILALKVASQAGCANATLSYVDGLTGSGLPVTNLVTYRGNSVPPALGTADVEVCVTEGVGPMIRGDSNLDGIVDISDAVRTLNWLFIDSANNPVNCKAAADPNGSTVIDIADGVYTLNFLFAANSPPPVAPYPECGFGTSDGDVALGCEQSPADCE